MYLDARTEKTQLKFSKITLTTLVDQLSQKAKTKLTARLIHKTSARKSGDEARFCDYEDEHSSLLL